MMDAIVGLLNLGWIGTMVSLLGLALALYLHFNGRPRLTVLREAVALIGPQDPETLDDIEIRYRGVAVPRVTAFKIYLWNAGGSMHDGDHLKTGDPLRLEVAPGQRILRTEIIHQSNSCNMCRIVGTDAATAGIHWAFLEPRQGMIINALHTGDVDQINILGTIRGTPEGLRSGKYGAIADELSRIVDAILKDSVAFVLTVILLLLVAIFVWIIRPDPAHLKETVNGVLILVTVAAFGLWWLSRSSIPAVLKSYQPSRVETTGDGVDGVSD